MHSRFQNSAFAGNSSSNSFNILGRSLQVEVPEAADTTLRLDSLASPLSNAKGIKRKWNLIDGSDPLLSLRLGHSSSSSDSKGSSATACTSLSSAKETEEASSMDIELDFSLHLGNEKSAASNKKPANLKMKGLQVPSPKFDLELSLSGGGSCQSEITAVQQHANRFQSLADMLRATNEESTSCGWRPGFGLPTLQASSSKETSSFLGHVPKNVIIPAAHVPKLSSSTAATTPISSGTCTSGLSQQLKPQLKNSSSSKLCQVEGCQKGARGASGRCISHGGGRRCQKHGCHKGAEAHGGGKRCAWGQPETEYAGQSSSGPCTSFARGKTGLCALHNSLVHDNRVHGGMTITSESQEPRVSSSETENEEEFSGSQDMNMDTMKARSATGSPETDVDLNEYEAGLGLAPEGRVHGGSLMMAMLGRDGGSGSTNGPKRWM
ncbi:unnamed protein product [Arabidopsis arenosa]|uniref:WRKY19-like zinc finger domain-containing protein n=1 Tax=Arabidopsis arenosa TaxID=38785 RepID=A0A8S1ZSL6_ARAAE|nr:unnamed protein product [Arabidopsis arenosa]